MASHDRSPLWEMSAGGSGDLGPPRTHWTRLSWMGDARLAALGSAVFVLSVVSWMVVVALTSARRLGLCCADDGYFAIIAKTLVNDLVYALPLSSSERSWFDPQVGSGPAFIMPGAAMIAMFGPQRQTTSARIKARIPRSLIDGINAASHRPHGFAHPLGRIVGKALVDLGHDFRRVEILNDAVGLRLEDRPHGEEAGFDHIEIQG